MTVRKIFCGWQQKVDENLQAIFYRLGHYIGQRPGICLVIPVCICFFLATGLKDLPYRNDPDYIFTPENGPAQDERHVFESNFPLNYSFSFNPSRLYRPGRYARIIITAKDGETLFRQKVWHEIQKLDQLIQKIQITQDEVDYSFENLCARWQDNCFQNVVVNQLGHKMEAIEGRQVNLTFPIFEGLPMAHIFGGADVSMRTTVGGTSNESTGIGIISSVKALQLSYFLNADSPKKDERGGKWEKALLQALERADGKSEDDGSSDGQGGQSGQWKWIKVDRFTGRTIPDQIDENVLTMLPNAGVTGALLFTFSFISCIEPGDWVKSKPWLGLAGLCTASLGIMAAYGLLAYCGIPFISLCAAAPFLILGIGMDDAFVILSAWRQTSVYDPVPIRLAEAYSEAAVSITITTLTDILCFIIGITSPFVSIQIFSVYAGTTTIVIYLVHIFYFGAALALSGYHEAENRHGLFPWREATPRSTLTDEKKSRLFRLFCIGGVADITKKKKMDDAERKTQWTELDKMDHPDHPIMVFFRDKWANWLVRPRVKFFLIVLYIVYLAVSFWGISKIEEGIDLERIAVQDYVKDFYELDKQYFLQYPFRVQVLVAGGHRNPDLDYSDPEVQDKIEKLMQEFESTRFAREGQIYNESWLRAFLHSIFYKEDRGGDNSTMTKLSKKDFMERLSKFLTLPTFAVWSLDVKFDAAKTRILASRLIVQCANLRDWRDQRDMVEKFRDIAKAAGPELQVTVFHPQFLFLDQFFVILSSTIQMVVVAMGVMVVVAMGVMLVVCLVMMPDPSCSIWVAGSIVSIEVGVLGFLAHWNVNLDVLSMIMLVMSIGFSVDFTAHISYAYLAKKGTAEERLRASLYSLGFPIVLGAITTILAVIIVATAPTDDFVSFFKAIFLVMIIATFHGLSVLPILLTFFGKENSKKSTPPDLPPPPTLYFVSPGVDDNQHESSHMESSRL